MIIAASQIDIYCITPTYNKSIIFTLIDERPKNNTNTNKEFEKIK